MDDWIISMTAVKEKFSLLLYLDAKKNVFLKQMFNIKEDESFVFWY